jgi:hypothetical protein
MLLLLIVIAVSFFSKKDKRYWLFAVSAMATQLFANLLFDVGFWSDGYITQIIRESTKNNFNELWLFPFQMIFGWGLPIYLIYKGYKRKEKSIESVVKTE